MSTETPNPQPGDRVRVVIDGVYERPGPSDTWVDHVIVNEYAGSVSVPRGAAVEVLERADDPKVGELRRENHDDDSGHSIWQVQENYDGERFWCCVYSTAPGNRDVQFPLEKMLDLPVVGYVPGSPAAYAAATKPGRVVRDPIGLGERLWRDLNRYARQGDLHAAAGVLSLHTTMSSDDAIAYVKDMSEYQAYLSEHGRTAVDPVEADRMRAMGFDRQPESKMSELGRALIQSVLDERTTEYVYERGDGSWKLDGTALAGVVADIVWAAIKRDRERGGR